MPGTRPLLMLAAGLALLWIALAVQSAGGATARSLSVVHKREDAIRNYDFTEKTVSRHKVDWAVSLLFFNNATINKVKDRLHGTYPHTGSKMNGRLDDGAGPVWDEDGGKKTIRCSNPVSGTDSYHWRVYADADDRMFNRSWGFYIFGTTHIDHNECWFGRWHGRSERAEQHVAARAATAYGSSRVLRNHRWFNNWEPWRKEGNHHWQNNGWATFVRVP